MAISEKMKIDELINQLQDKVIELQEVQKTGRETIEVEFSRLTFLEFLQENFKHPCRVIIE